MTVLLTGASSFTGLWFAESLAAAGFDVVAPLRLASEDYEGLREARVQRLARVATIVDSCPFGSDAFVALLRDRAIHTLCHHAAQVENYKSLDFDAAEALRLNTYNLRLVLENAKALRSVVLTGSVFEADEGAGTQPREAFSPYGLSKTLTGEVFRYWCGHNKLPLTRFVIPNPFGPYEEPRFCHYLMKTWSSGHVAEVKTPDYVRDNIPVSLLAKIYADGVARIAGGERLERMAPSFYAESQGAFTQRLAREMKARLPLACAVDLLPQTEFVEPLVRVNTDKTDVARFGWNEIAAWDDLATYYQATYLAPAKG